MASIVDAVLKEVERRQVGKVEEVELVIGELTRLGADQMEFAFEIITKNTALEGSRLVIKDEPIEVKCASCAYEGGAGRLDDEGFGHNIPILSCPVCSRPVEVLKGKSCTVRSLKVVE